MIVVRGISTEGLPHDRRRQGAPDGARAYPGVHRTRPQSDRHEGVLLGPSAGAEVSARVASEIVSGDRKLLQLSAVGRRSVPLIVSAATGAGVTRPTRPRVSPTAWTSVGPTAWASIRTAARTSIRTTARPSVRTAARASIRTTAWTSVRTTARPSIRSAPWTGVKPTTWTSVTRPSGTRVAYAVSESVRRERKRSSNSCNCENCSNHGSPFRSSWRRFPTRILRVSP